MLGREFQALFMSTTEPVDGEGDTKNPTKSPCDPYVFNTALTRSKSLVVVVGSPVALLRIEEHMKGLYGERACCWSSYIRLCLEKDTFIIPPEVEPREAKRLEFNLRLKAKLFGSEASRIASLLADSIQHSKPHVASMQQISSPSNTASRQHALPPANRASTSTTSEQHATNPTSRKLASNIPHTAMRTTIQTAPDPFAFHQSLHHTSGSIAPEQQVSPAVSSTSIITSQQNPRRVQDSKPPQLPTPHKQDHRRVQDSIPPRHPTPRMRVLDSRPPQPHKAALQGLHHQVQDSVPPQPNPPCKYYMKLILYLNNSYTPF